VYGVAKAKKPVSSGGKTTPPKAAEAAVKNAVAEPAKPVTEAKAAANKSVDKTTTSAASAAAKPKSDPKPDLGKDTKRMDATKPVVDVTKPDADAKPTFESKATDAKPAPKTTSAPEKAAEVKPVETKPVSKPEPAPQKSGGVMPLVFGGVIAAGLGFIASEANFMGWRTQDDSLRTALAAQQDEIDALKGAEQPAPDMSGIEASIAALTDQITGFDARLAEVEARPPQTISVENGEPVEDVRAELTAMQSALEAQRDEISALLGNAKSVEEATAAAARAAAGQRALAQVTAAISNGGGYADAIAQMNDAGIMDLPAALTDPADDGVTTLISLQSRFPDVARDALTAARAATTDDGNTGVGGFLRRQLGARSVTPREGNDPDAVLSRAEAAVRNGDVAAALAEIEALPDGTKDPMQGWIADARVRADAEAAVQDLSQRLTAN
jgi:hypothetical protein